MIGYEFGIAALCTFIFGLIGVAFLALIVYAILLFIKLAKRAIKALDIYIDEKTRDQ
jgi:hypothetical protein